MSGGRTPPAVLVALLAGCIHAGGAVDERPRFVVANQSPQQRIAFVSERDGDGEIYVMKPDGRGVRQLTHNGFSLPPSNRSRRPATQSDRDEAPAFSPDGRWIVFRSTRGGEMKGSDGEIFLMPAGGGGQRRLTQDDRAQFSPSFSADGRRIVFESCATVRSECELVAVDRVGAARKRLLSESTLLLEPAWSPDGGRLAYVRMHAQSHFEHLEIHVRRVEGDEDEQLTDDSTGDASPAWSPDGARIAFVSNRAESAPCFTHDCEGSTTELYVMDDDGANVTRLTETAAEESTPAWSPDGGQILFARKDSFEAPSELWFVNADGTCPTRLGEGSSPAWYGPAGSRARRLGC